MSEDYVMPEARYEEAAREMSGAPAEPGMAPVPLYGIPSLGQGEEVVPLWKKPAFCYVVGAAAGLGLGYAFFGWFKPKYMKSNPGKRRTTRKPKKKQEEAAEE